jgi:hypothetical protein
MARIDAHPQDYLWNLFYSNVKPLKTKNHLNTLITVIERLLVWMPFFLSDGNLFYEKT